jgi:hypothetical protein
MPNFIVQPGHAIHDGHKVRNEGEAIELSDADAELLTASGHVAPAAAENQAPQPTEEELAAQAAALAAAAAAAEPQAAAEEAAEPAAEEAAKPAKGKGK